MNRFVYTITTIIFLLIAGATVFMVIERDDVKKPNVVATVQEKEEQVEPTETEVESEENTEAEQKPEEETVEEETKYYTYTVVDANWLNIRAEQGKDNSPVGKLPRGYTGYVVEMTGTWTLVCADGYIGYCSDNYLDLVEIDASEYPEELKVYDEASAGEKVFEGKFGTVEEGNSKSVKWR